MRKNGTTPIGTYIWIISKDKPQHRVGKVQLIDASHCYTIRRRPIGKKRNDITSECAALVSKAYEEYADNARYGDNEIWCESKIFPIEAFGYFKVTIERPLRDDSGEIILKKGKPVPDTALRDTELIPMTEDIDSYFNREIQPFVSDAWIDKKKTKTGYEIPMIRYFYEFPVFPSHNQLFEQIRALEDSIQESMNMLFEGDRQ